MIDIEWWYLEDPRDRENERLRALHSKSELDLREDPDYAAFLAVPPGELGAEPEPDEEQLLF